LELICVAALLNPFLVSVHRMSYEDPNSDDQVPACGGPRGSGPRTGRAAGLFLDDQPQGLHCPSAVRRPGPQDVLQDRLPGHHPAPDRLRRPPGRPGAGEGAALLDPVLRGRPAAKKGEAVVLLLRATTSATDRGLIG